MSTFNEDSRVKIPALLHLARLGYQYLSRKEARWDMHNNIFPEIFEAALLRIHPELRPAEVSGLLDEINLYLQNEDLGRDLHKRLIAPRPLYSSTRSIEADFGVDGLCTMLRSSAESEINTWLSTSAGRGRADYYTCSLTMGAV